jgi:hypothetical protein
MLKVNLCQKSFPNQNKTVYGKPEDTSGPKFKVKVQEKVNMLHLRTVL